MVKDLELISGKIEEAFRMTGIDVVEITDLTDMESIDLKQKYLREDKYNVIRIKKINGNEENYIVHVSRRKNNEN